MAGYDLHSGDYIGTSEDELWSLFTYVFSDASIKTSTYKFALIKSICDQIYDLREENGVYFISRFKLFERFTENYWNLVSKYNLKQMKYNGKSQCSRVERIIIDAISKYSLPREIYFHSVKPKERDEIVNQVADECSEYVIDALCTDFTGKLYSYELEKGIYVGKEAHAFISKYKNEIEKLNYYAWGKMLEDINDGPVTEKLLSKLDDAVPQRSDLSVYSNILFNVMNINECFYCKNELNDGMHVDHFIPWTFMKTDNLWNFVLSCPKCNQAKSDDLLDMSFVNKIENQNNEILRNKKMHPLIEREFSNYENGLIRRVWQYARMSGYKVITIKQLKKRKSKKN